MLTASTVAALVLAAVVGWVGYGRTKQALDAEAARLEEARQARHETEQASGRLEANLKLSLEAFEKVFEAAGGNRWPFLLWAARGAADRLNRAAVPAGRPVTSTAAGRRGRAGRWKRLPPQTAVLEAILAFYDKFAEQNATNPKLQFEAGKAYRRVGEAQLWLGNQEKAAASLHRPPAPSRSWRPRFPATSITALNWP